MKYLFAFLVFFSMAGCNNDDDGNGVVCSDIYVFGLNIMVRDAATGGIITNEITVTAIDGSYSEELSFNFDTFIGAGERPGNYIITIEAEGYENFTSETIVVSLTEDGCHVIPESRTFEIQPV